MRRIRSSPREIAVSVLGEAGLDFLIVTTRGESSFEKKILELVLFDGGITSPPPGVGVK